MGAINLVGSKVILAVCNFFLLVYGFTLVTGGMLVLFDTERIILSKLLVGGPFSDFAQPYFYYVAIALALLGLTLAAVGILGCWASCLQHYWILSLYFILVLALLLCEGSVYGIAWIWPKCMGLSLDSDGLVKAVQRYYGVAGQDQFTAAVDLAQTYFNCCGIYSANEYDMSLWRLQGLGQPLAIPLSCCMLKNRNEDKSYLNPVPLNSSLCQVLEKQSHLGYRYTVGCKDSLDGWYRQHYVLFLSVGLVAILIEFVVLLSTILTCTRIYHYNQAPKGNGQNLEQADYGFQKGPSPSYGGYSNETYAMTDSFKQNYKLLDKV